MRMLKARKKSVSLIVVLAFFMTLFPMALPVFAADYSRIGSVVSVRDGENQTLNTVRVETSAGQIREGDTVIVSLPNDFDFNVTNTVYDIWQEYADKTDTHGIAYGDANTYIFFPAGGDDALYELANNGHIVIKSLDKNEFSITVKDDASAVKDGLLFIYMNKVDVDKGFDGDITLTFKAPSGSGFDNGEVFVGRVTGGKVCVEVTNSETFGDDGGDVTIRIVEDMAGALVNDDESVKLILPNGFGWAVVSEVDVIFGDDIIFDPSGFTYGWFDFNVQGENLFLKVANSTSKPSCIEFTAKIEVLNKLEAENGDIIAKVKGQSEFFSNSITVGSYKPNLWDFNDGQIPVGFNLFVLDNGVPGNSTRFPNNEAFVVCNTESPNETSSWNRRPFSLCGTSWFEPPVVADRWVTTSPVTLCGKWSLSWDARSNEEAFLEDYNVLVSTSGSNPEDFTTLLSVKQEHYDWVIHDVDLSDYEGETVYVAFQLVTNDGAYLWLDNINVGPVEDVKAPLVSTLGADSVSDKVATLTGTIKPGSEKIIEKGFECKATAGGEYMVYPVTDRSLSYKLTGLKPLTNYTFRAYAKTSTGTYYGAEKNFTTKEPVSSGGAGGGGGGGVPPTGISVDSDGATVRNKDVEVLIPKGAVDTKIKVTIKKVNSSVVSIPEGFDLAGSVYDISKNKSGNFKQDVTITLPFDKSKVDSQKDDLGIYWWDGSNWFILGDIQVNWSEGTISGKTTHFTQFAVLVKHKDGQPEKVIPEPNIFLNDIAGHWAEDYIRSFVTSGLINGYPDGSFKPNNMITRAEFAKILVSAFDVPALRGKVFKDTERHWAEGFIASAHTAGIISGYNEDFFGPDDPVTREQIASMVVKAANLSGGSEEISFKDGHSISSWARKSVAIASANGIITGYGDYTFRPRNNATRAEAVTIIYRMLY